MRTSTKTLLAPRRVKTMEEPRRTYIPAAGHDWSLPLYDPFVKLLKKPCSCFDKLGANGNFH